MSRHRITSHPVLSRAQARRHYSQNFLADPAAARAVVRASGVGAGELVVEIGPGDGMLTRHLLDTAGRVLAYEIDARHAAALRARYAGDDRLRCHHADIRNVRPPREPFAVVANIPFAASTDILRWCLAAQQLTSATLLAQKEFARKYSGQYRRWPKTTVAHWPAVRTSLGPALARDRFRPVPRVDAAVLRLHRRERALLSHRDLVLYRQLVDLGYLGLGGSLAATLATRFPARRVRAACARAGIATDAPVGTVPPDSWITLYRALGDHA